jgi:phospholipid/cholesterol/gamma-HCH transport system permease protein
MARDAIGTAEAAAGFEASAEGAGGVRLAFRGALDAGAVARLWPEATRRAKGAAPLTLDLGRVSALDTAGAVLLLRLEREAGGGARWQGLPQGGPARAVLERTRRALEAPVAPRGAGDGGLPWLGRLGRATVGRGDRMLDQVAFLGEALVAGAGVARRPWRLRFGEVMRHLDEAGLRAFGLTVLLGFLIGLILAFQSSVSLRRFGAEYYIPNLVGISLLRELGPLMAAVVLAGRTGSAFAAELGTMRVNEEVDALRIMGIDPVAWLVLPRVLAAVLVMPVLALLMDLSGLLGMGAVMLSLGYVPAGVAGQLQYALRLWDLWGGLWKAAAFGLSIGLIGCRAGLNAGGGPRAVGDAATGAVVGGIVSIVVLDGAFAVMFYRLGW